MLSMHLFILWVFRRGADPPLLPVHWTKNILHIYKLTSIIRYEDRIGALQSKIRELESAASKQAQAERADDTRLKELIHGLKADNADLTSTVKKFERELADKNDRITVLQVQLGQFWGYLSGMH